MIVRWPAFLILGAGLAVLSADAQHIGASSPPTQFVDNRLLAEVHARVMAPVPTPEQDALAATRRGEFGLIVTAMDTGGWGSPQAVTCHTPFGRAPRTLVVFTFNDLITEPVRRWWEYAATYNRTVVAHPDYPDGDLCRPAGETDYRSFPDPSVPAQIVTGPAGSLHEAARRSDRREVLRWLHRTPVNQFDSLGMTALAWAVIRGNSEAIDALLAANADPWAEQMFTMSAVHWAAVYGRADLFTAISADRPFTSWPARYLLAALRGGSIPIVEQILREPHEGLSPQQLPGTAEVLDLILRASPELADPLLRSAAGRRPPQLDLVQLALAHGADPSGGLAGVTNGIYPGTVEIVAALIAAGADPNHLSDRHRPVWDAVNTLTLDDEVGDADRRAMEIFHLLIAAGADINLPNYQNRPAVWALLFPYSYAHRELDASFITLALLEMLVANGLDLNAEQNGERVLPLVEAQAGANSDLAVTLRRLGAI